MPKSRMWLWIGLAAAAIVLLIGLAGREPAPQVNVASVGRENISATISSNGKVEPVEPHVVRAQLNTFVERVPVKEGQQVVAGQVLVELDSADAAAEVARLRQQLLAAQEAIRANSAGGPADALAQIESDLRQAQADAVRLRSEYVAYERLLAKQAASQFEVDQAKLALDRALEQLRVVQEKKAEFARQAKLNLDRATLQEKQAQAELQAAEGKLRSTRVTSPEPGTLYSLPARPGQYVRVGDLLAEVADLRRVRVRAFVDEPELGALQEGQEVEITWDAFLGRAWKGRTEQLPKAVVPRGTRSVGELICSVGNEKLELLPNINVNVFIRVGSRGNALVVPRGAVRMDGGQRYVFVLDGHALRRRNVRVGIASPTKFEILNGLVEGDRVALPGDVELRDGLTVRATETE